jgi:hypothetical protein
MLYDKRTLEKKDKWINRQNWSDDVIMRTTTLSMLDDDATDNDNYGIPADDETDNDNCWRMMTNNYANDIRWRKEWWKIRTEVNDDRSEENDDWRQQNKNDTVNEKNNSVKSPFENFGHWKF